MPTNKKQLKPYGSEKYLNVDRYHAAFPDTVQKKLQQLREAIQQAAPKAVETISYNIPTFKQNKNLVHYAAYKTHIGFYPTAKPLVVFQKELEKFKTSKGAIQFPINEALPLTLIKKIVRFRVEADSIFNSPIKPGKLNKSPKICKNGHQYFEKGDCPICETNKKPEHNFLSLLALPARRALEKANINSLEQLSKYSEKELLKLHGVGKTSIPILKTALEQLKLGFFVGK
jgi:uncharacterized protein YdhG (YjbR/CyaY superfamily)